MEQETTHSKQPSTIKIVSRGAAPVRAALLGHLKPGFQEVYQYRTRLRGQVCSLCSDAGTAAGRESPGRRRRYITVYPFDCPGWYHVRPRHAAQ